MRGEVVINKTMDETVNSTGLKNTLRFLRIDTLLSFQGPLGCVHSSDAVLALLEHALPVLVTAPC
jgi:hypothetical protein